ncbi:serine palmitoyltransferase 1 [Fopius arisanus]|uniref:Serine palmitoyltransferase 1 n=1 Tax=Fopius arisanus TaxID=64838 RepID=A0A9R1TVI3_9HYME|nr:PREDICTED: serine palmitoyltransferase 1 [Fopius arisanus]
MGVKYKLLESINIFGGSFQYEVIAAVFVGLWLAWLLSKSRRTKRVGVSDEEVQKKLSEWHPESLVPAGDPDHPFLSPRLVSSKIGKRLTINGRDCLNLATHNYLGLLADTRIEEKAISTTRKYGIGSCGPRGFYGTVDVHLDLEERLAKFMEAEEAIVYSYGFSTVASAIPAYCKRRDIIFADEKVNFSIQKGFDASRSTVKYFKHNDVGDLERLLIEQVRIDEKNPKKAEKIRRFLVVEGIYMNTGLICPLPELVALCRKYRLRIFIDESISFGTLGDTGKGVTEFFGVPRHEIDIIIGSLEWAVASIGGFCVGSSFVIEHQRLSGLGYCFSASLPPLLTAAAITAIDIMEQESNDLFAKLRRNCIDLQSRLYQLEHFELSAQPESPVKHLFLRRQLDREGECILLNNISNKCIENNLAIIMPVYLHVERELPRPSLKICVSNCLKEEDLQFAVETLAKCSNEVFAL